MSITRQQRKFYETFSRQGSSSSLIEIAPKDVAILIHIAYYDLYNVYADWFLPKYIDIIGTSIYNITKESLEKIPEITIDESFLLLEKSGATDINNIIYLYLYNLCQLYRKRFKYYNILKNQNFSTSD